MSSKITNTPAPWGIEETTNDIYVGPLRRDGSGKIAEIVYSVSIFAISSEARNRHLCNAHFICDMVNNGSPVLTDAPITEAQVVAFLRFKIAEIKAKLGADKYAVAGITVTDYTHGNPTIRCRVDSGAFTDVLPEADSFASAFASIEKRTPANIAREKREAAARLLAEADALAPAAQ